MSLICSGEFSKVLKVIANQQEIVDKIMTNFDLLVSLTDEKSQMIEPTFVSLAPYNPEMGDWIIKKFLSKPGYE